MSYVYATSVAIVLKSDTPLTDDMVELIQDEIESSVDMVPKVLDAYATSFKVSFDEPIEVSPLVLQKG